MRAAVILGLGCTPHDLKPFQDQKTPDIEWQIGLPSASDQADAVLLFGGDGTIHRHLGQLVKLGLPVLIVPAGSGNDFARALSLRSARDSLAAWKAYSSTKGNVRSVDLGVVTPVGITGESAAPHDPSRNSISGPRYFGSVAGVGLDAEIARRANRLPRWLRGNGGYALTYAPTIFQFAAFPMKILTPAPPRPSGQNFAVKEDQVARDADAADRMDSSDTPKIAWTVRKDQPTLLAAFANTSTYGGGMKIAPRALMDDGLLDVCVIGSVDPFKLACLFPTVYFGRHLNIREVDYFSADRLRVETEHPLDLYADGEYVCRTPAEVSVEREALRVICLPSKSGSREEKS